MFKIGILIAALLLATGCTRVVTKLVPKETIKYETMPTSLLKNYITTPTPPNRVDFVKAGPLEREVLLSNTIVDLYTTIGKYKLKLKAIKDYNDKLTNLSKSTSHE